MRATSIAKSFLFAGVLAIVMAVLGSCAGAGTGGGNPGTGGAADPNDVRIAGQLSGLVASSGVAAPVGGSSLSSAIVTVAGLPIVGGELDVQAAEETEVAGDGVFALDVPRESDVEHVFLVRGPGEGVGADQGLGFIELPVAGESSAGWNLAGVDSGAVDLGALSGTAGTFLADNAPEDLLDVLNADQAEVLLQAQRDNYLKDAYNEYLNTEDGGEWTLGHNFSREGQGLAEATNQWTVPAGFFQDTAEVTFYYAIPAEFNLDEETFLDVPSLQTGAQEFALYPPAPMSADSAEFSTSEVYGPDDPFVVQGFTEETNEFGDVFRKANFLIVGPLPQGEGPWRLRVDDVEVGVYDWDLSSPFDADGNYLYPVPRLRLTVDEATSAISTWEYEYWLWNPQIGEYEQITGSLESLPVSNPIVMSWSGTSASGGPTFGDVTDPAGTVQNGFGGQTLFLEAGPGRSTLDNIYVRYSIGGRAYEFAWDRS